MRGGSALTSYTRYTVTPRHAPSPLWVRVLKATVLVIVVASSLTAGAAVSWLRATAAQVAHNDPVQVREASKQLSPVLPSQPVNILVIGGDGAPNRQGIRSDTLIVLRLDPHARTISMLSVPRDELVQIPGYGQAKINAAFSYGGVTLCLAVVKQYLGIPINDFVYVDFSGFEDVVNRLGGAYLMIDTRYYNNTATDDWASIDLEPGYQLLDGAQALGFVRFRHDQNGDFTRILRQQMFLRAMKRQVAASATLTSFPRLLSAATTMSQYLVSDISGLGKLYRLVSLVAAVDTSHIYQTSIAGSTPTIGGIDYVVSTPEQVQTAVHELYDPVAVPTQQTASGATTVSAPQLPVAKVALTVLNGSGVSGIAARATTLLRRAGYLATDGGNAASFSYATTSIACDGSSLSVARRLAAQLAPANVQQLGFGAPTGHVTVTLGSSFSGRLAAAASVPSGQRVVTTTNAPPYDAADWRALQRRTSLPLYAPSSWPAGLGYAQFRACRIATSQGRVPAAVVVGTAPQGGYWDVQALAWGDPPLLTGPDRTETVAGRTYLLYYADAHLHLVAWHAGSDTYWVSNTLDDELSNSQMLTLAESCVAVR